MGVGFSHGFQKCFLIHNAGYFDDGSQHGGIGEVFPKGFQGDFSCVDGVDISLVTPKFGKELFLGLCRIDDDGSVFLETIRDPYGVQ